jgi:transcriptional regulator
MYIPNQFEEQRIEVLHELIRAHSLATVVTVSADGLNANHIPLLLAETGNAFGVLRGHVARANPILTDIKDGSESLIVFQGPQSYITPSWYATKLETGKVVPTWNYAVVHAHGVLRVVDDALWLRAQLEALTDQTEAAFLKPWAVSDAPHDYIEKIMAGIVGIEMEITKLIGKWKASQNQPKKNQISVTKGLRESGSDNAAEMAKLVEKSLTS